MAPPSKRRRIEPSAVEEVNFDLADRQEYLTGFHKRKLQRAKHAREIAEKKARAERIEERKRLREGRKVELERHVQEVNDLLRHAQDSGGYEDDVGGDSEEDGEKAHEWVGIEDPPPIDHEAEYIDEEKYTTVTVEELDVSREGMRKVHEDGAEPLNSLQDGDKVESDTETKKPPKRIWTKDKPKTGTDKPKKKRKKFRYETKAERRFSRTKERAKNRKQASTRRAA